MGLGKRIATPLLCQKLQQGANLALCLPCAEFKAPSPNLLWIWFFFPLSKLGSDLLCRCGSCSCQEALHHSPKLGNTSRHSHSHQLCAGMPPSKLTYRNKTGRASFQAKQTSMLFSTVCKAASETTPDGCQNFRKKHASINKQDLLLCCKKTQAKEKSGNST